jgi:hypothetical protein
MGSIVSAAGVKQGKDACTYGKQGGYRDERRQVKICAQHARTPEKTVTIYVVS